ncbi:MAG: nuclear transport factor 2 family protein [Bdellovibrionales bacterium]|nr:nuclear transport factor 2 family protein [Bdellovibrionales bacterium]
MEKTELIKKCFNEYTGENIEVLRELYDDRIHFQDPLTDIKGMEELIRYYRHAYSKVKQIRFDFHEFHVAGQTVTGEWNMTLSVSGLNGGKPYTVHGVSVLTFSEESGKIIKHRDYLDIGSMVYEQVPVFGSAVRAIKSRLH